MLRVQLRTTVFCGQFEVGPMDGTRNYRAVAQLRFEIRIVTARWHRIIT
jgi:hypothetical protein